LNAVFDARGFLRMFLLKDVIEFRLVWLV
jgi:hypothetical protein